MCVIKIDLNVIDFVLLENNYESFANEAQITI